MKIVIGLILVALSCKSWALDMKWKEKAKDRLEKQIRKSKAKASDLAIYIAGGEGDPVVVYSQNPKQKMIPASISKLITAAATITQFPPGTKFKTQLISSGAIVGNKLNGDLVLKGGGDPSFVSETMWFLVNSFVRTDINEIQGDIVVDDSYFDSQRFDLSRQKERIDKAYDAPTGAMSFNWNSVNIFIRPATLGQAAHVFIDPENEYVRLKGTVKTGPSGGKNTVSVNRDEDAKGPGDVINVSGSIPADAAEFTVYKNITQPDLWAGYNLKSFLKQRGITISGKVRAGLTPVTAKVLAESESRTIESILSDMSKYSNNYIAEMLTKNIAAVNGPPGTIEKGMKYLKDYLRVSGVAETDFEIENPSGLTRKNRITAESMWKVLNKMRSQFRYQPEFVTSLPIAGVDGTLRKRMKGSAAERWVRAKTGLLDGVVSLAGYAGRVDGTVIPFVFMYNGGADGGQIRDLFDELATILVE